jgi:predicted neuraminidase
VLLTAASSAAQQSTPVTNSAQFDGVFRASKVDGMEEAYLGQLFPSSHAANLVRLQNGDLLCFWFSGSGEGESNVAIVMAHLRAGSKRWSNTIAIDHQPGRSFQNPVAFQLPGGRLWLLHTSQAAGQGQANAEVLYLTSDDFGHTWTAPHALFSQPGSFIRQPPVLIDGKTWLLPMYYTPSHSITEGAEADYSVVKKTTDGGKSWKECKILQSGGLVQPSIVRLAPEKFLALFRSRYADFIYLSTSKDGCDWGVPTATPLPNNNSSIQAALLQDGSLVVAFNNSSAGTTRKKARSSVRKPLSIALSQDGGISWPWVRDIETGDSAGPLDSTKENGGRVEEYSYPSVLQEGNGKIDVAFTYDRRVIKIVKFNEDWIRQGTTHGQFKGDYSK